MNRSAPALLLFASLNAIPATRAQTTQAQPPAAAPASQSTAQAATQQAPNPDKKVWTNDDVGDLRDRSAISTVGATNAKPSRVTETSTAGSRSREAKWYRDQILRLQVKLPALDNQIRQLQAALNGETVSSAQTYGWPKFGDWREELARLQKQRADITAKITSLEDEARHKGVSPNMLP